MFQTHNPNEVLFNMDGDAIKDGLKRLDFNSEIAEERLKRTIKRLKEKNLHFDSIADLITFNPQQLVSLSVKKMEANIKAGVEVDVENVNMTLVSIITALMTAMPTESRLDDEDWYRGIEFAVVIKHPDLLRKGDVFSYAPYIDELYLYIWIGVILAYLVARVGEAKMFIPLINEFIKENFEKDKTINELVENIDVLKKEFAQKRNEYQSRAIAAERTLGIAKKEFSEATGKYERDRTRWAREKYALQEQVKELSRYKPEL
jgi:hypothetical protein